METLRNDEAGGLLSAVQNDRLYRGGSSDQGPLINLIQTEVAAKQFYPETFGPWDGLGTLDDESTHLFDHERLAGIVRGDD